MRANVATGGGAWPAVRRHPFSYRHACDTQVMRWRWRRARLAEDERYFVVLIPENGQAVCADTPLRLTSLLVEDQQGRVDVVMDDGGL